MRRGDGFLSTQRRGFYIFERKAAPLSHDYNMCRWGGDKKRMGHANAQSQPGGGGCEEFGPKIAKVKHATIEY